MLKRTSFLFISLILLSFSSFSQEIDDMYFNSKDRVAKKVKKITPAQIILSKYRSGTTANNSSDKIDSKLLNRYKLESTTNNLSENEDNNNLKSLKYNRDNLFRSKNINNSFLDINLLLMYGWTNPNYYYMMNPYELSYLDYQGISPYSNIWMPRNLYGLRNLASFDPMMFFSNPFLSSINPLMSPALFNINYPGMSTYGLCAWTSTYPSWIFTNNGTGGGLQHTLSNSHFYFDSEPTAPVVRGPRSGRGSLRGISSNSDLSVDRYFGRRESGITNTNIRKNSKSISSNMDDTQNAYMKTYSSRVEGYATRSSRSSTYKYSDRRLDSQNRLSSSRIEAINSSFSGNSLRSSRSNSSLSSIDDMSGRRSVYSAPGNYNNRGSVFSRSSGGSGRSSVFNSGSSSSNSSYSSYSSGGSSSGGYSGGSRSSGGTSVVSSGSSGGSSRGNN